ncbi:MAG: Cell division protein CrgA [Acidimicrobiales bacterium]|nr:MAG: cell division protein CrgA [Actinomycetota bacterium]MBV6508083.1 Cell division protein CrgA [Acidimicrobiales bacterium]RIK05292.1 MAG: hypothetical protein DCC48_10450 [Acidobacteriota bacterium]
MAKPAKRKIQGGKPSSSRVTPKGTQPGQRRKDGSTPVRVEIKGPSPIWVPILMFGLFILGLAVIFLNYVEVLPAAPTNWYLLLGLGCILAGIITATQYR